MEWLNYHHLLYFWMVAREGGVVRAARKLGLSQPTVSNQVRALEGMFGEPLFDRIGRRLVLTDVGQTVFRYADEIFSLGRELVDTVRGRAGGRPLRFTVGVANVVSKIIAYQLLVPAMRLSIPVRVVCREDRADTLLSALAVHEIDLVLSDAPVPPGVHIKAYSHLLGESGVTCFAAPALAARLRRRFPASLAGAPMLLPGESTILRRQLEDWFQDMDIRPAVVGEFDDSALMKVFGEHGIGAFVAPSVIARDIARQHHVAVVGEITSIRARFFGISYERRITHPAVVAIAAHARQETFQRQAIGRRGASSRRASTDSGQSGRPRATDQSA
jgi:LysR family transcriptional regulator, transcriptional activator of nhaA